LRVGCIDKQVPLGSGGIGRWKKIRFVYFVYFFVLTGGSIGTLELGAWELK
jgi:hypothetical protein